MRNYNIIKAAAISELMEKLSFYGSVPGQMYPGGPVNTPAPIGDRTETLLMEAAQPSPRYLEAVQKKGLLGKYYNDKMTQDYAVNPTEGDKGVPARALPVADQNSAPRYSAPVQPKYPTPAPVKAAPDLNALFKEHHATSFNPKSSMDRAKMQKLKAKYGQ